MQKLFEIVNARHGQLRFFAHDNGAVSRSLKTYGEWAENELNFVKQFVPLRSTVVDVGAYIGTHSLAFAGFVGPGGKVVSIEPQGESFQLLKENIAANGLTNVRLEHAVAADCMGTANITPVDISREGSFGSAAVRQSDLLRTTSPIPNKPRSVRAITIDSLELDSCALIKIDVEGFEHLVISGAEQTIRRTSPVLYAECNSLAGGLKTFDEMRKRGYRVRMHVVDAFNAGNLFGVTENIFGRAREVALVGVSKLGSLSVGEIILKPYELLLEIESADDLALGMLNKPQYWGEILEVSDAAKSGGDSWLKNTSAVLDERDQAREIAHQAFQAADASKKQAEEAAREAHSAREAAARAEVETERLRGECDRVNALLVRRERKLKALEASLSWRITGPFRKVGRIFRRPEDN